MSDTLARTRLNAALEGRYRIERQLGEGGMATVYLADDVRHERKVALKVLKPELAAVVGADRFLAEIKTTANLQHPHILPLFDSGEADSFLFYVMPYVEGESLRERLDREHQLPVDEAVSITTKVAGALQVAHEQGVIHRDIKPANILLSKGEPLVSDFGIALAVGAAGGGRLTETGLSLGTPHYMSPEQATGDLSVGAAADIYALGCVLYEMLVGDPPYTASTPQAILGKIIAGKLTSATEQRTSVPTNVDAAIRKALEKVPADRFTTVREFARSLGDPSFAYGVSNSSPSAFEPDAARSHVSTVSVTAAVLFAALAAWGWLRPIPEVELAVATRAPLTGLTTSGALAVSPDGRWVAARGQGEQSSAIFLRGASDLEWRELEGTSAVRFVDFSPGSDWLVANRADGSMVKIPTRGGPAVRIGQGFFPQWGENDSIVFVDDTQFGGRILMTGPNGGEPTVLYASDSIPAAFAHMLPDASGILFNTPTLGSPLNSRVYLFDRRTGETRELQPSGVSPRYVTSGHLVFGHADQVLMAAPFDLDSREVTGPAISVLPELAVNQGGVAFYDVSRNGTLVYRSESTDQSYYFVEVTLEGEERLLDHPAGDFALPRYSPDGTQIAYEALRSDGAAEARIYDVTTGADRQFTSGGGSQPVWSRDGEDLFYMQEGIGYRRPADSSLPPTRLFAAESPVWFNDVGSDGTAVLWAGVGLSDLYLWRPNSGSEDLEELVVNDNFWGHAHISPDGRWITYTSDQDGELRVYANSFPEFDTPRSISPGFAVDPVWNSDGSAIYYRSAERFYAIPVRTEPTLTVSGSPRELFERREYVTRFGNSFRNWDLHPDGDRLLMLADPTPGDEESLTAIIVTGWFDELNRLVPVD